MTREERIDILNENKEIIEDLGISPKKVDYVRYVDDDIKDSIEKDLSAYAYEKKFVIFEQMDTISAALKHYDQKGVDFLVFASAKNYGGGVWTGSRAQEEDIFLCTDLQMMRDEMQEKIYPLRGVLAADCHIIRDARFNMLDEPVQARAFFAAAPNLSSGREQTPDLYTRMCTLTETTFDDRKGSTLVIGAWGCGVFKNDPGKVAQCFRKMMSLFLDDYKQVVVAIPDKRLLDIFRKELE